MTTQEREAALDNDPTNPCFGCGPNNPRGLRLSFRRAGDRVETTLIAHATMEGWPGRLHSGVLYVAMLEVANWTVFGLTGRIGVPTRTGAPKTASWVPAGTRLRIAGRVTSKSENGVNVIVEVFDPEERLVSSLDRDFILPNRREFLERMGYAEIPDVFAGLIPE